MKTRKIFFGLVFVLAVLNMLAAVPQVDGFNVMRVATQSIKNGIQIQCEITDASGIYDTVLDYDGVGAQPADNSVYVKWDLDGEIENNARYTSMTLNETIGEDIFVADHPLNVDEVVANKSLVYKVYAYNNGLIQGSSDLFSTIKIISTGEIKDGKKNIELLVIMRKVIKMYKGNEIRFFIFDQSISYREF
ncbi:MAG: hypothetical protein ABID79_01835 [Elusimicrobiota bacterium]